jgi:hypothetical protein
MCERFFARFGAFAKLILTPKNGNLVARLYGRHEAEMHAFA